jgi:hypothetical protein
MIYKKILNKKNFLCYNNKIMLINKIIISLIIINYNLIFFNDLFSINHEFIFLK